MDLHITRDDLTRGLARVTAVAERRASNPLLACVLLTATPTGLRMAATDTEIAYGGDYAAQVVTGGAIAVDAANLFQIVRALPDQTVRLTTGSAKDYRLEVTSGRSKFRVPGSPAVDFPEPSPFEPRGTARVDLRPLIERTAFAVATEDHRFGLNGAHLEDRGGVLRMVATDGHRLSAAEVAYEGTVAISPRTLVPRKALAVLAKLLTGGAVEVGFGDGAIRVTRESESWWFRLLDGEFPEYSAVVPAPGAKHRILMARDSLAAALKRVAIVTEGAARAVAFNFADGEVTLRVTSASRGEVTEIVAAEMEGEPISAGFNVAYLAEILGVIEGPTVTMELAHPLAPCLVADPEDAGAFFVVMPMRLD